MVDLGYRVIGHAPPEEVVIGVGHARVAVLCTMGISL